MKTNTTPDPRLMPDDKCLVVSVPEAASCSEYRRRLPTCSPDGESYRRFASDTASSSLALRCSPSSTRRRPPSDGFTIGVGKLDLEAPPATKRHHRPSSLFTVGYKPLAGLSAHERAMSPGS